MLYNDHGQEAQDLHRIDNTCCFAGITGVTKTQPCGGIARLASSMTRRSNTRPFSIWWSVGAEKMAVAKFLKSLGGSPELSLCMGKPASTTVRAQGTPTPGEYKWHTDPSPHLSISLHFKIVPIHFLHQFRIEDHVICILTEVCSSNIGFSDWFCCWVVCRNLEPDRQMYRRSWYFHSKNVQGD